MATILQEILRDLWRLAERAGRAVRLMSAGLVVLALTVGSLRIVWLMRAEIWAGAGGVTWQSGELQKLVVALLLVWIAEKFLGLWTSYRERFGGS